MYSASLKTLLALGRDAQGKPSPAALQGTADVLMTLGYPDAAARIAGYPDWYGPLVRGERLPPSTLDGRPMTPEDFWSSLFFTPIASRALVNRGKAADLVRLYRAAFGDPDGFISRKGHGESLGYLGPTLAVALDSAGRPSEAHYILAAAANAAEGRFRNSHGARAPAAEMALVRAAQGEREQALQLLDRAVRRGWLPDGRRQTLDLAQEPAYRSLRRDPRFQALRTRILDHIARERAELGPITI